MTTDIRPRTKTQGKEVLNAGSGPPGPRRLYGGFRITDWREVALDINPTAKPDYVGSVADMRHIFEVERFDAIWSSHNIEHLHAHEVVPSLREFKRVLKPDGFVLVTCPDIEAVARQLVAFGLDHPVYESAAGMITVRDILFGYGRAIAAGDRFMAHHTGFTSESLGRVALEAGFTEARVGVGDRYDLWAVFMMPRARTRDVMACLEPRESEFLFPASDL